MNVHRDVQPAVCHGLSHEQSCNAGERTLLLTTTCWWPFPARLALRFARLGWRVEALCPAEHPLLKTQAVQRVHHYHPLRPLSVLSTAIDAARPGLVVPCDDRALGHLLSLQVGAPLSHAGQRLQSCCTPISAQEFLLRRAALIGLAQEAGVRAPDMRAIDNAADLREAIAEFGFPVVLKVDASWGGMGVIVAHTRDQAEKALRALGRRGGLLFAMRSLLVNRDLYPALPAMTGQRPQVYAQRFVRGRPANVAAVGWRGDCLASVEAEALVTRDSLGAATVVRRIHQPEMARAAATLIRRLNISGFCGFDFVIEEGTGDAHLIEMNPRATPTSHLALGCASDLVTALDARLQDLPFQPSMQQENQIVALFPDAWLYTPQSPYLASGHHDVPWLEPGLMREMARLPYPDRGAIARLWNRWRA